ncbi:MAG: dicarboxylate/amino acid:cation symporter [Lachnospiraceae bacterium]|nr:dicarboxylate/amino acid:cation symporter [Lachnospiraceae bacterium]
MGIYLLTTVIAVSMGIGIALLIQPGEWGFALSGSVETASVIVDTSIDTSILSTIINIVPSNILAPFVESNTLQVMFLAVLCGLAVGAIGEYSRTLKELIARLSPITFFRKNREGMLTSFTLCSSSAAMPTNLRTCTEKLGISPKVCNFSIPLGATVNMDGSCIYLCITGLFLARAYGVSVVLAALKAPIEAIGLIMAIEPFLDMFITMSNTTGDVMAALVVARNENLLDVEKYQKL